MESNKILKCYRNVYNKYIFFLVMSSSNIFYWVEIAEKLVFKKHKHEQPKVI